MGEGGVILFSLKLRTVNSLCFLTLYCSSETDPTAILYLLQRKHNSLYKSSIKDMASRPQDTIELMLRGHLEIIIMINKK